MKAEIISIGTELLMGETLDTNASYLASQFPALGIELLWVSQVGDSQPRLMEVLKRAWQRSELILMTGGLGPTGDDLTRESIAEMLGEKMTIEPSLEQALRGRFGRQGTQMPLSNLKQATLIPSARAIPNAQGTAPGWWVERDGRTLIAMPGPPSEMLPMWQEKVAPQLARSAKNVIITRTFKTFGLSEAAVGDMVNDMFASENPILGVYAKPDGIQLRLAAKAENRSTAEKLLSTSGQKIKAVLNEYIWGTDDDTAAGAVGSLLSGKQLTLAVMEDFSAGLIATSLVDLPESNKFFKGGVVAPSYEAKTAFGVDPSLITKYGGVGPETAGAMAEAVRTLLKADIGLACSAAGETAERPMGFTYIGIADEKGSQAVLRPRRKQHVAASALLELRKWLLSRPGG